MTESQPSSGNRKSTKKRGSQNTQPAEEILAQVNRDIAAIYTLTRDPQTDKPPQLTPAEYMKLYTAVFDYVSAEWGPGLPSGRSRGGPNGEELYRTLEREIKTYCQGIRALILASSHDQETNTARVLIEVYMAQWSKYAKLAELIAGLTHAMERHWLKRDFDECKMELYFIQILHKKNWKEEVLHVAVGTTAATTISSDIGDAAAALQKSGEEGSESDRELFVRFKSSLESLNLVSEEWSGWVVVQMPAKDDHED